MDVEARSARCQSLRRLVLLEADEAGRVRSGASLGISSMLRACRRAYEVAVRKRRARADARSNENSDLQGAQERRAGES